MAQNETKVHPELVKYDIPIRNRTLASLRMRTCVTPRVLSRNAAMRNSPNSVINSPIGSPLLRPSSIGQENSQFYRQNPLDADAIEMLSRKVSESKNTLKSLQNAETVYMLATGDIFMKSSDVLRPRASELNQISNLTKPYSPNEDFVSDGSRKQSDNLNNILQDIAVTTASPRSRQLISPQISMMELQSSDKTQYRVRDYRIQSPRYNNFSKSLLSGRDSDLYANYSNNLQSQNVVTAPRFQVAVKSGTKLPLQNKDQSYRRFKGSLRRPPSSYGSSRTQNGQVFGKHQLTLSSDNLYIGKQNDEFEISEESVSYREKLNRVKTGSPILAVSKAIQQLGVSEKPISKSETCISTNETLRQSKATATHSTYTFDSNSFCEKDTNRPPMNRFDHSINNNLENDTESASVCTQDEDDCFEDDMDGEVQEEVTYQSEDSCTGDNDIDCVDDTAISCLEDDNVTEIEETEASESGQSSKNCGDNNALTEDGFIVKPAVITSIFSNCPPVINFGTKHEKVEPLPSHVKKLLKWKMSPITPIVVRSTVARSGFKPSKKSYDWIGYFGKHMKASGFRSLKEYQKINHFPGSFQVGRKDRLWRNLSRMQAKFGKKEFSFVPQSYILPWDKKLLKSAWEEAGSKQKYIIKPPASARGIGIRLIHKWNQIPTRKPVLVQKYLSRPLLLNGFKFDIRLYVYVTSFDPLRIYLFDDGLVRFATTKYSSSTKHLSNRYMHLTNYSINKNSGDFQQNDDVNICQGHKWSLKALWGFLQEKGVDTDKIWLQLKDIVVKTLISVEHFTNSLIKANCRRKSCCHELFGFDIMLDDKYHPWILEVNISPSLHSNSPLDVEIKGQMVSDMFNLAGFQIPDKKQIMVHAQTQSGNTTSSSSGATFSQDKRKESLEVTYDTRAKHTYFARHFKQLDEAELMTMMLDVLTVNDIQMLVESEDENSRRGRFQRVFPGGEETRKYLHFFEQPRYYNTLLHIWELKYQFQKQRGLLLLESFCRRGLHLIGNLSSNSKIPLEHVWSMSRLGKMFSSPRTDPKYLPVMLKSSASSSSIGSSTMSMPGRISSACKWEASSMKTSNSVSSIEPKITSSRSTK